MCYCMLYNVTVSVHIIQTGIDKNPRWGHAYEKLCKNSNQLPRVGLINLRTVDYSSGRETLKRSTSSEAFRKPLNTDDGKMMVWAS